jgi:tRNA nucleotidyltransferase (CCA-adding enzyme)
MRGADRGHEDLGRQAAQAMKTWVVGGAVRDRLLGLPVNDRDWVVVGSTPEAMQAAGFQPVGKDFPVFLHPQTHEEYALARTERKSGPGYHGFTFHAAPDVTLAQDLARRDLTINAIAQDPDTGDLVDPFGGQADLANRVLRHVSPAFVEDPVRLLRLARLAARFADFTLAPETARLLRQMVADREVDHLVPERVWQELARGLMTDHPHRMVEVLRDCGALGVLLPELDALWGVPQPLEHHPEVDTGVHQLLVLAVAARLQAPLPVRWACLVHDLGKAGTPPDQWPRHIGHEARSVVLARRVAERWKVPAECRALGEIVAREHGNIHRSADFGAPAVLRLLERCDALRRPQRFRDALLACECDARGRAGLADAPYPQRQRLGAALDAALAADAQGAASDAASQGLTGPQVGERVRAVRLAAVAQACSPA